MCRVYLFTNAGGYLRQYDLRSDSSPSGSAPQLSALIACVAVGLPVLFGG